MGILTGHTCAQAPQRVEAIGKSLARSRPRILGDDQGPYGSAIDPAIGMASDFLIDRTDVQTRPHSDAIQ